MLEDVPSAVLNMCIVARNGIAGGQLTVLVITLMNLAFKARRVRKAFQHLRTLSTTVFSEESIPSRFEAAPGNSPGGLLLGMAMESAGF